MSSFTRFSLKNPLAVFILILLVLAGGLYSSTQLKQEMMPDMSSPLVLVTVAYPGASAAEMAKTVTQPIEQVVQNLEGVKTVNSTVTPGATFTSVQFDFSDDLDKRTQQVEEAVSSVKLPERAERPKVQKNSDAASPIFYASLIAKDGVTLDEFEREIRDELLPAVQALNGVAGVQAYGLRESRIAVTVDAAKLAEKKLTHPQLLQILQAQNTAAPVGQVTFDNKQESVTIDGTFASLEDIGNLLLAPQPQEVRLKDVAQVERLNEAEMVTVADGKPAVAFNVIKTRDANTVEVSALVQEEVKKFEQKVEFQMLFDSAELVQNSVNSMVREGALGALFASLLILFFLRNIRATLISILSIPLSILTTLALMQQFDLTLNIMTLGGMAVATGRVVDDSIVVIENIIRRLQTEKMSRDLALNACRDVIKAITSSTLTTIAVFAPLGMLSGEVGVLFGPFALTVVFSLLSSLLVSVTVVPMLAFVMMRRLKPKEHAQEYALARYYRKALRWSLNHKAAVLVLSVLLLVGSLPLAGVAGFTFLPEDEEKIVLVSLQMPQGTELKELEAHARRMDEELRRDDAVRSTQLTIGAPSGETRGVNRPNEAMWYVFLEPGRDVDAFLTKHKAALKPSDPGITLNLFSFSPVGGSSAGIQVVVNGPNKQAIEAGAQQITEALQTVEGTENIQNNIQAGLQGVDLAVRRDDALKHGLTTAQAMQLLHPFLHEQQVGALEQEQGEAKEQIFLKLEPTGGLSNLEAVADLELLTPHGHAVKVKDIADVKRVDQQGSLQLRNGEEYAVVSGLISAADQKTVNDAIRAKLDALTLPSDVTYSLGGADAEMNDMMTDMGMAIAMAIGLVYIVMVVTFGEGKAPFAILFSIPFALIGSLVATVLTKQPISLASMIGFLMLIGIVVTNAIVLLDRVKGQMAEGETIRDSLLQAGSVRLRPILMTAIATICAIFPLALGMGESVLISQGLAVVVIGGLTTSTLLTLFIVPVLFEMLHGKRSRRERKQVIAAQPAS